MIPKVLRMPKIRFWKNDRSYRLIDPKRVQESNCEFAAAISARREYERVHFEAAVARMGWDAAMPAVGKNMPRQHSTREQE